MNMNIVEIGFEDGTKDRAIALNRILLANRIIEFLGIDYLVELRQNSDKKNFFKIIRAEVEDEKVDLGFCGKEIEAMEILLNKVDLIKSRKNLTEKNIWKKRSNQNKIEQSEDSSFLRTISGNNSLLNFIEEKDVKDKCPPLMMGMRKKEKKKSIDEKWLKSESMKTNSEREEEENERLEREMEKKSDEIISKELNVIEEVELKRYVDRMDRPSDAQKFLKNLDIQLSSKYEKNTSEKIFRPQNKIKKNNYFNDKGNDKVSVLQKLKKKIKKICF